MKMTGEDYREIRRPGEHGILEVKKKKCGNMLCLNTSVKCCRQVKNKSWEWTISFSNKGVMLFGDLDKSILVES